MKKTFYRVCNLDTKQGLWYNYEGNFTGLIHNDFNFCQNSSLEMEFDEDIVGYISVTDDYDSLFHWFTKEEILKLQEHGYYIHVYESDDHRFYERFQHYIVNQDSAVLVKRIELNAEDI